MVEIVPAVLEKDAASVRTELEKWALYADAIQLDVMDGQFVAAETWNNPEEIDFREYDVHVMAHLMINNPVQHISSWITAGVQRATIHFSALEDPAIEIPAARKLCKKAGIQLGISINPGVLVHDLLPHIEETDFILVMGVKPGRSGQELQKSVIDKITHLVDHLGSRPIGVDGGVDGEAAPRFVKAGATVLITRSYLNTFEDPAAGIKQLHILSEQ